MQQVPGIVQVLALKASKFTEVADDSAVVDICPKERARARVALDFVEFPIYAN